MPIPTPEPGLVISYAYLWDHEAKAGRENGAKDRPCVIALSVVRRPDGETVVTVLPVTHVPPTDPAEAIEIPQSVKRHLGLDDNRSWIVVSQGDQFVWPGYDLRRIRRTGQYDYGYLPPRLFNEVLEALRAWHRSHRVKLTAR